MVMVMITFKSNWPHLCPLGLTAISPLGANGLVPLHGISESDSPSSSLSVYVPDEFPEEGLAPLLMTGGLKPDYPNASAPAFTS